MWAQGKEKIDVGPGRDSAIQRGHLKQQGERMLSRCKGDSQEFISSPFRDVYTTWPGVTAVCSCFRCPSFYYPDEVVIALSDLCI